jgi:hypothetical protein
MLWIRIGDGCAWVSFLFNGLIIRSHMGYLGKGLALALVFALGMKVFQVGKNTTRRDKNAAHFRLKS